MATDSSDCALSDTALSDLFHPHLTDPQSLLVLSRTLVLSGYLQFMLIAALKVFFFFFLVVLHSFWDPSSLTRN